MVEEQGVSAIVESLASSTLVDGPDPATTTQTKKQSKTKTASWADSVPEPVQPEAFPITRMGLVESFSVSNSSSIMINFDLVEFKRKEDGFHSIIVKPDDGSPILHYMWTNYVKRNPDILTGQFNIWQNMPPDVKQPISEVIGPKLPAYWINYALDTVSTDNVMYGEYLYSRGAYAKEVNVSMNNFILMAIAVYRMRKQDVPITSRMFDIWTHFICGFPVEEKITFDELSEALVNLSYSSVLNLASLKPLRDGSTMTYSLPPQRLVPFSSLPYPIKYGHRTIVFRSGAVNLLAVTDLTTTKTNLIDNERFYPLMHLEGNFKNPFEHYQLWSSKCDRTLRLKCASSIKTDRLIRIVINSGHAEKKNQILRRVRQIAKDHNASDPIYRNGTTFIGWRASPMSRDAIRAFKKNVLKALDDEFDFNRKSFEMIHLQNLEIRSSMLDNSSADNSEIATSPILSHFLVSLLYAIRQYLYAHYQEQFGPRGTFKWRDPVLYLVFPAQSIYCCIKDSIGLSDHDKAIYHDFLCFYHYILYHRSLPYDFIRLCDHRYYACQVMRQKDVALEDAFLWPTLLRYFSSDVLREKREANPVWNKIKAKLANGESWVALNEDIYSKDYDGEQTLYQRLCTLSGVRLKSDGSRIPVLDYAAKMTNYELSVLEEVD